MNKQLLFLLWIPTILFGQEESIQKINSIKDDVYLHPIDCITPYTLKKGE
jgi:hypothetical protein